ncbi:MAG: hypothetical protein ACOX1V_05015 [Candidatus Iainarchaeum sp.]|jgi:hypothetical protein
MAKSVYITAVIATIAILLIVFFSVNVSESSRVSEFNEEIKQISLESNLYSAYEDFDANNSEVFCLVMRQNITNLSDRSTSLEKKLLAYSDNSFNTKEFYLSKRSFLISNMILYRNFQKAKEFCDFNIIPVLFFYSEDSSCEVECGLIGTQLNSLSKTCSSFKAFNFPYNWDAYEFTKILEVKYNVKKSGTLVIGDEVIDHPLKFEELKTKLGC